MSFEIFLRPSLHPLPLHCIGRVSLQDNDAPLHEQTHEEWGARPAGAPRGPQFLSQKSLTEAKDDLYLIHRPSQPYSEAPAHYRAIDRRARMPLHWSSVQAWILLNEEPVGYSELVKTQ